ncbi:MAG: RNA-binding S4 domain-containing protein [Bermanella sp.]
MKQVILDKEPVELYKILKFEGIAENGGQAKAVIANGEVQVNGEVETQKRKKIVSGDIIEFGQEKYQMKTA